MKINDRKIWVTSDFHFGHRNVIKYCNRPFANLSEMNTQLIKNYNKLVNNEDIVYILGDISFLNTQSTTEIIRSLHGYKFLIKGNHDPKSNAAYRKMGFMEVYDKPIVLMDKYILSHEPIATYTSHLINIYGHMHDKAINDSDNRFCCCLEKTDYKPITLEEIDKHTNKFVPF